MYFMYVATVAQSDNRLYLKVKDQFKMLKPTSQRVKFNNLKSGHIKAFSTAEVTSCK